MSAHGTGQPMNPIESLRIDGKPNILARFVIPEMSLSSARESMTRHTFTLTIIPSLLHDLVKPLYTVLVEELRRDDELCGKAQDALACAGYPDILEVLKSPELAEMVFGRYLLQECVGRFTRDGALRADYWFDQISSCEIANDRVLLHGICFS